MKLSAYHKKCGDNVSLVCSYGDLFHRCIEMDAKQQPPENFIFSETSNITNLAGRERRKKTIIRYYYKEGLKFDKIIISKVFTKTDCPKEILELDVCEYGGTGFFYDNAPPLPDEIEHSMPDYHLYDPWIEKCITNGAKEKEFTYYKNYSIGFLTRGCFRKCSFCVNRNKTSCDKHSKISEFMDVSRPKLCFIDDNFFACKDWRNIIAEVKKTGKKFQFKQGLDERLLNDEKIHDIIMWNYDGDYIFAFDDVNDGDIIESKLKRWYELYPTFKKRIKFYILCGYDREGKYDLDFWANDIANTFRRCYILARYCALPYIMRHENYMASPYRQMYIALAMWSNQPSFFKKNSFRTYCKMRGMSNKNYGKYKTEFAQYLLDGNKKGSCWRAMEDFEEKHPKIASRYYDIIPDNIVNYGHETHQKTM